ncbi:hypothetical protein CF326_g4157 [Tilletia indica]|nr:hypothetical protein CF326_g4157 [Tilletia indica]
MAGPHSLKKLKKIKSSSFRPEVERTVKARKDKTIKPTRKNRVERTIRARAHAASGVAFDDNKGTMKITLNNRDASAAEAEASKALMRSVTAQRDEIEKRRKGLSRINEKIFKELAFVKDENVKLRAEVKTLGEHNRLLKQDTSEVLKTKLIKQHAKYNEVLTKLQNEVNAHAATKAKLAKFKKATKQL